LTKLQKRKEHLKDVEEDLIADKVQFHKLRHRPQARAKREEEEKILLEREDKYFSKLNLTSQIKPSSVQLFQTMEAEEVAEKDVNTDTDFGFGDAHAINQYYPMLYFWYFCVVMVRTAIEISFCFFYYMLYWPNFFMVMPMVYLCHDNNELVFILQQVLYLFKNSGSMQRYCRVLRRSTVFKDPHNLGYVWLFLLYYHRQYKIIKMRI